MAQEPTLLSGDDFDALFKIFAESAFRLETRESYYEKGEMKAFLDRGPAAIPADFLAEWYELMRSHVKAGRQIRRVRIVSEPHSDYTKFGIWLARRNIDAGEDIRYLPRKKAGSLNLPDIDYWLFDDSQMYIVRFSGDDSLLGAEKVTDAKSIAQARVWRDVAWRNAIPRDVYAQATEL